MRKKALVLLAATVLLCGCAGLKEKLKNALDTARESGSEVSQRLGERRPSKVKKTLPNGLTVVVQESFGAPVAAVQVWVEAGSADEKDEEAGLAHVLEHMVFKGTEKRGVGEVATEVESMGGDLNAFTSYDLTVYHITLASRFMDRAMDILSDLTRNATFNENELKKEREVVLEEIRRGNDNPRSRIFKYLFKEAYQTHNYKRPVIGFEETVSGFEQGDLMAFYKKWYTPSNMTVIVTGDVKVDEVMEAAQKWFGDMEGGPAPSGPQSPRFETELPQSEVRTQVYYEEVADAYMYMGFHIPPFASKDMAALDVLSVILGGGETSRLTYRVRTERRLVNRIWGYAYTPRDPGMFMVGANLSEEKSTESMEMILKQLYLLKHEKIEDWELERSKLALDTESIYARETVDGQARHLGHFVTMTGDPDYEKTYMDAVKSVTADDIMEVAKKYFVDRNLTAVAIMPLEMEDEQERFDEARMDWIVKDVGTWDESYVKGGLTEPEPIEPPEVPDPESSPALSGAPPVAGEPVKYVLSNGMRLIVRENHTIPLVDVRAAFAAGLRRETADINGINNFIAETITEGTANHSASEIHSFIESRAGSVNGFSGRNTMGVTLETPSQFFYSCLPMFSDIIRYPAFADTEVERMRGIILAEIASIQDSPARMAFKLYRSELYRDHPFGMDILGTERSVSDMTREDLQNYYQEFAVPENLVIAVVGDVKAAQVKDRFEELFGDWVAEPYVPSPIPDEEPPKEIREAVECRDVNQANLVIGYQGTRVTSEDRFPLSVMNSVLSGMSGRLFTTLRGEQSLAYSVYAFAQEAVDPGFLGVYIGTSPDKEDMARAGIMSELEKIRSEQVTDEELTRAQEVLIGEHEIRLQKMSTQAANYCLDEINGLGFRASDYYVQKVQQVTKEDVIKAANEYIKQQAYVYAAVKPCSPQASR